MHVCQVNIRANLRVASVTLNIFTITSSMLVSGLLLKYSHLRFLASKHSGCIQVNVEIVLRIDNQKNGLETRAVALFVMLHP